MPPQLRPAGPDDAPGWAEVVAAAVPYLVVTPASAAHDLGDPTVVAQQVALLDGQLVGVARVRRTGDGLRVLVLVHPDHRRRGIGSALAAEVLDPAAGRRLVALVNDDDGSLDAARSWGFAPERRHRISGVDPRTVVGPPSLPSLPGRMVPLAQVGPRAAWDCLVETGGDDPSGLSQAPPYDVFHATMWQAPTHDGEVSRAWVDDGRVLGLAVLLVGAGRGFNAYTGTVPDARGRGLARALKHSALLALGEAGVSVCTTGNDEDNAAMLAVNRALGYAPIAASWTATREGT